MRYTFKPDHLPSHLKQGLCTRIPELQWRNKTRLCNAVRAGKVIAELKMLLDDEMILEKCKSSKPESVEEL